MMLSKMTIEAGKTETSYAKIFVEVHTDQYNEFGTDKNYKYISFYGEIHDDEWSKEGDNIDIISGQVKQKILMMFPTERNKKFIEQFWSKYHLTPYDEKVLKEIEEFTGCKFINIGNIKEEKK